MVVGSVGVGGVVFVGEVGVLLAPGDEGGCVVVGVVVGVECVVFPVFAVVVVDLGEAGVWWGWSVL